MKREMGSRTEGARRLKTVNFEHLGNKENRADSNLKFLLRIWTTIEKGGKSK